MSYEIKTISGRIIFAGEYDSLKECAEEAVNNCAYLRSANLSGADLRSADLSGAYLRSAYLRSANLRSADLRSADLRSADLSGADLRSADLSGAYLRSADLSGAEGLIKERVNQLLFLYDQPGKIRLYKLVTKDYKSPFSCVQLNYPVGKTVKVGDANTNVNELCEAGVNVGTLDWCLKEYRQGYRIMIVEFTAKDIACIPTATDGKLRLHKCKVVEEKDLTGLVYDKMPQED